MEHEFTSQIKQVLFQDFRKDADAVYALNPLIQYINVKTKSATRGSKARGSFASLYAIYVLLKDYLQKGFDKRGKYSEYEGAKFTDIFQRQRELPFGSKLQNHALNNRTNEEFRKYFPQTVDIPIVRDLQTNRYWINENLITVRIRQKEYNLAKSIIKIIDRYVETKQDSFKRFIETSERLKKIKANSTSEAEDFIFSLLEPNVDARIFEVVSYAILKYYYHDQMVYFGFELDNIQEENLKLYKTGRTNANDGGIDFVMRPLGRFFQVTETLDIRKYLLDIDKIEKYPISFVIKSEDSIDTLKRKLQEGAEKRYSIKSIVRKYMNCIEEIINLPELRQRFTESVAQGYIKEIFDEIIIQSKVEFNYDEEID
jgi:uncharacterized protein (DUF1697 family)